MTHGPSMPRPSDRWIPWYFVIFFVVLALALTPMCIIAFRTNTGTVTENAYEKGLAYNKLIEAAARQQALGWHSELSLLSSSQPDEVNVVFVLKDNSGKGLDDASVNFWLVRPTQDGMDQTTLMKTQTGGRYTASLKLPAHGLWEARIAVTAEGKNYQMTKRVVIP